MAETRAFDPRKRQLLKAALICRSHYLQRVYVARLYEWDEESQKQRKKPLTKRLALGTLKH